MRCHMLEFTANVGVPNSVRVAGVAAGQSNAAPRNQLSRQRSLPRNNGIPDRIVENITRLDALQRLLCAIEAGIRKFNSLISRQTYLERSFHSCKVQALNVGCLIGPIAGCATHI